MIVSVPHSTPNVTLVGRSLAVLAVVPCALLLCGELRHLVIGGPLLPGSHDLWLSVHLTAVMPSLPLGAYVLLTPKGGSRHRLLGRIWIVLMLTVGLSSYGLRDDGGRFSYIHILAITLLIGIPTGLYQAIKGDVTRHRWTMTRLYGALVIAGLYAFAPSRTLGEWVFG